MSACTCTITDPKTWFYYGSAVEPGSQWEPDYDCPKHFPLNPVSDNGSGVSDTETGESA